MPVPPGQYGRGGILACLPTTHGATMSSQLPTLPFSLVQVLSGNKAHNWFNTDEMRNQCRTVLPSAKGHTINGSLYKCNFYCFLPFPFLSL